MSLKKAYAGTFESNDIYITIEEKPQDHGVQIELQSIVLAQFGQSIKNTITETIAACGISTGLQVEANDKGALPCTIEARTKTALSRLGLIKEGK